MTCVQVPCIQATHVLKSNFFGENNVSFLHLHMSLISGLWKIVEFSYMFLLQYTMLFWWKFTRQIWQGDGYFNNPFG